MATSLRVSRGDQCRSDLPFLAATMWTRADRSQDVAQEQGIKAMPTFKAYKNGEAVDEFTGAVPAKLTVSTSSNARTCRYRHTVTVAGPCLHGSSRTRTPRLPTSRRMR